MSTKFAVSWDNGASACGTFPWRFDTEADAEAYGREWAYESNVRDFGDPDPLDGYSYEVIAIEVDDSDPDDCDGDEHQRMQRYARP